MFSAFYFFPMDWWSCLSLSHSRSLSLSLFLLLSCSHSRSRSLSWQSRQSVYHMESVGRKTVSSVFLIDLTTPPPPTPTHTHPHPHLVLPLSLTYAKDVEAETLSDRFTDQLVRQAVEPNMATQVEVALLLILGREDRQRTAVKRLRCSG